MMIAAAAAKPLQLCPTVRPHRRQPTRLHRPWDSPGENTGVGCHSLLQCMKVKSGSEVAQSCLTLRDPIYCSLPGSSVHGKELDMIEQLHFTFTGFFQCLLLLQGTGCRCLGSVAVALKP